MSCGNQCTNCTCATEEVAPEANALRNLRDSCYLELAALQNKLQLIERDARILDAACTFLDSLPEGSYSVKGNCDVVFYNHAEDGLHADRANNYAAIMAEWNPKILVTKKGNLKVTF